MTEVLENIIYMMHNAPEKHLEIAYIIEKYSDNGILASLPFKQLKMLEQDILLTIKN